MVSPRQILTAIISGVTTGHGDDHGGAGGINDVHNRTVTLDDNQVITGLKTFSTNPTFNGGAIPLGALAQDPLARALHTGSQVAATISDLSEAVDDRVNGLLRATDDISLDYDDAGNTLTIGLVSGAFAPLAGATFTGQVAVPDLSVSGLTGSTQGGRIVGFSAGTPTTGAHSLNDLVYDVTNNLWLRCSVAGTPGTWVAAGSTTFVTTFTGGDATGVTDSTSALQSAIDALQTAGGGTLLIPGHSTYLVSMQSSASYRRAITMRPNVIIKGLDRRTSVIKLAPNQTYQGVQSAIFANDTVAVADAGGCGLENLTVDQNAPNNPPPTVSGPSDPRFLVHITKASAPVSIKRCNFINIDGVNGLYIVSDIQDLVDIDDNMFLVNPSAASIAAGSHDASIIYYNATGRSDSCTTTALSTTVLDALITANDLGRMISPSSTTGSNIVAGSKITAVTPGVSFVMDNAATASGTVNLVIGVGPNAELKVTDNVFQGNPTSAGAIGNIDGVVGDIVNAGVGAGAAVETHGARQTITGNRVSNCGLLGNFSGINNQLTSSLVVSNNVCIGVKHGMQVYALPYNTSVDGLDKVVITGNTFEIETDAWAYQTAGVDIFCRGIYVLGENPIRNLTIANNVVRYRSFISAGFGSIESPGCGIYVSSIPYRYEHRNWTIIGNSIDSPHSAGIYVQGFVRGLEVGFNKIRNPGQIASLPTTYKAGILINSDGSVANVHDNLIYDDQASTTLVTGISTVGLGGPVAAPGTITATPAITGGTLAAATYTYEVTCVTANGETLPSASVTAVVASGTTGSVVLTWAAVASGTTGGPGHYRIYGRVGGSLGLIGTIVAGSSPTFTDTGAASVGAVPPSADTTFHNLSDLVLRNNQIYQKTGSTVTPILVDTRSDTSRAPFIDMRVNRYVQPTGPVQYRSKLVDKANSAVYTQTAGPTGSTWSTTADQGPPGSASLNEQYLKPANILYQNIDRRGPFSNGLTITSQRIQAVAIGLPSGLIVNSISFLTGTTAGSGTIRHWWFALLDSSRVLLALTADKGATALPATTLHTLPIASTAAGAGSSFTTTYEGLYYLCIVVDADTVPTLGGVTSTSTALGLGTNMTPIVMGFNAGPYTTLPTFPTTVGALTASTPTYYAGVA